MQDYNFWADILSTFRSSSDLVKVIWVFSFACAPVFMVLSVVNAVIKLRSKKDPGRHMFSFNTRDYGLVEIYTSDKVPQIKSSTQRQSKQVQSKQGQSKQTQDKMPLRH